jgi:two-component sensor histidine kinase
MDQLDRYGDLFAWAPALALLAVTALISFSRIFERNPPSLCLLLAVIFWIWSDVTHGFVSDPVLKLVLFYLQFVFLAFVPAAWLGTCFRLIGWRDRYQFVTLLLFWTVALGFIVLLAVDTQTHWFFRSLELPAGSWTFSRQNGPAYVVFVAILFASLAGGGVLLARSRFFFSLLDRRRSGLLLWGIGLPLVAGVLDGLRVVAFAHLVLMPWALLLTSAFFLYAIVRGRLSVPVPLAYEIVVQQMAEPVVVMDSLQRPVWINTAAKNLLSDLSQGSEKRWAEFFPDLEAQFGLLRSGGEVVIQRGVREYRVQGTPTQDPKSGFEALAFVFHDITGLKAEQNRLEALVAERTSLLHQSNVKLEAELKKSIEAQVRQQQLLSEKDLLLQEVNHRVKNNLQIIMSLINLQARRLPRGSAMAERYAATQGRIRSISLVHELIYRTEFGTGLDFRTYLEELVHGISTLYDQPGARVEILPSSRPVQGGVDFSVDFGLVVNELVTNAFKHGIVPAGGGLVTVGLELEGSTLVLRVRDTGSGYTPQESDGTSLGLSLVRAVLKKYKAELQLWHDSGTIAEVRIPWEDQ